jgi:anti-sigma B factor antagonist
MLEMDRTFAIRALTVVRVAGEVDVASAPELDSLLEKLPAAGEDVVVDLTDVTFLDSTGLGVLVGAWNRCDKSDPPSQLSLVVATSEIERLLEVTGLTDVFQTYKSLDQATAS